MVGMAGRGELVFIVDGNTSITGHCFGAGFGGSLTRSPRCWGADAVSLAAGPVIKLIKPESGSEWIFTSGREGRRRLAEVSPPGPNPSPGSPKRG